MVERLPKTFTLHISTIKGIKELHERGVKINQNTIMKMSETAIVETAIREFLKSQGIIRRKCRFMSDIRKKEVFCEKFGEHKKLRFCIETCKFWENVPEPKRRVYYDRY